MAEVVKMPKMSDTMTEGVLAKWHKKVGDTVKTGDLVAEVETDKATMDFESFQEGTLLYVGPAEGESVPVDGVIAVLGKPGEDFKALISGVSGGSEAAVPAPATEESSSASSDKAEGTEGTNATAGAPDANQAGQAPASPVATTHSNGQVNDQTAQDQNRLKASPLARKMAEEKGISLETVKGSAENGRIVKKDIENYKVQESPAAAASVNGSGKTQGTASDDSLYEEVAVSQMRKTIARRLAESKFTAPHFYLTMSVRMDKAMELRSRLNEVATVKISFNDIVLKAVAASLKLNPKVNSSWLGDKIRYNHQVNIGVAVAVDEGLLVPVVRNADQKSLSHISTEVKDFAQKAKDKKLQPSDWEGSTFTISNLGMFGIDEFTAIINPPDACILAVGGIQNVPVVEAGQVVAGNVMKLTLSCDHRVVDGAIGSAFLQTLKGMLEEPFKILV